MPGTANTPQPRAEEPRTPASATFHVDVLTPSYNYARFLDDALTSVELQDRPVRHIVVDGNSGDGSPELLAARERRGLQWVSEPDKGQSDALNKALDRAEAPWIGWLNADEFYGPRTLAAAESAVTDREDVDILFGDCAFVDVDGRLLRLLPAHRFRASVLRDYGCFIPSCTTFVRRDFLERHRWSTDFHHAMDWHLWLRMAEAGGRFRYDPRVLSFFRIHEAQVTAVPSELDPAEFARLDTLRRRTTGSPTSRFLDLRGRLDHIGSKIIDGGYRRQVRARAFRGRDMRWWLGQEQFEAVARLEDRVAISPAHSSGIGQAPEVGAAR
jgi:glycosyltransferase involved in cell wall biosynthesis